MLISHGIACQGPEYLPKDPTRASGVVGHKGKLVHTLCYAQVPFSVLRTLILIEMG